MGFRTTLDPSRRPARPFVARPGFSHRTKLVGNAVRCAKSLLDTFMQLPGMFGGRFTQPAFASGSLGLSDMNVLYMAGTGLRSSEPMSGPKEFRDRIQRIASSAPESYMSAGNVRTSYEATFYDDIARRRAPEWSDDLYRGAVYVLSREKRIEVLPDFSIRFYNQTAHLHEIGRNLSLRLSTCTTLHDLASIVQDMMEPAFKIVDFYLLSPSDRGPEVRIVSGEKMEASSYQSWKVPEQGSAFTDQMTIISDLTKDPKVSEADRIKYAARYKNPKEMMFCSDPRGRIYFKLAEWIATGEEGDAKVLISPVAIRGELTSALTSIADIVGNAVTRIVAEKTAREVWDNETAMEATASKGVVKQLKGSRKTTRELNDFVQDLRSRAKMWKAWRSGIEINAFSRQARRFFSITLTRPARVLGGTVDEMAGYLHEIWEGIAEDFLKTVIKRAATINFTVELLGGKPVVAAFYAITNRATGYYYEVFAAHKEAQQLGFSTNAISSFVKNCLISEAAKKMALKRIPVIRFWIAKLLAKLYIAGILKNPPAVFKEAKPRIAFLTDTSVAVGPFWKFVTDFFPKPNSSYKPMVEEVRALLPEGEGYQPIPVTIKSSRGELQVFVVKGTEARQANDSIPRYSNDPDAKVAEEVVSALKNPVALGLEPGHYDLVVIMEPSIEDFRTFYRNRRTRQNIAKLQVGVAAI